MSQCHDLSEYDPAGYQAAEPCPPNVQEAGCHDRYEDPEETDQDPRAARTPAAWSGTTRLRRGGRS